MGCRARGEVYLGRREVLCRSLLGSEWNTTVESLFNSVPVTNVKITSRNIYISRFKSYVLTPNPIKLIFNIFIITLFKIHIPITPSSLN